MLEGRLFERCFSTVIYKNNMVTAPKQAQTARKPLEKVHCMHESLWIISNESSIA